MRRVDHPLVLIPFGALAEQVLVRVGAPGRDPDVAIVRGPDAATALELELHRLLRAGERGASGPRVDLVAVVDAVTSLPADLAPTLTQITDLIEAKFSAVLSPRASADQRAVGLHLVVLAPPIVAQGAARDVLNSLAALPGPAGRALDSLLTRIWLLSSQSTAGLLSIDDTVSSVAGFLSALFGSGVRDAEAVRQRLAFADPSKRFAMISVGRLDLPMDRLVAFQETRAAWEALDTLVQRVNAPASASEGLPDAFDLAAAVAPLTEGDVARAARTTPDRALALSAVQRVEIDAARALRVASQTLLDGALGARHRLDAVPGLIYALESRSAAATEGLTTDAVTPAKEPVAPPPAEAPVAEIAPPASSSVASGAGLGLAGAFVGLAAALRLSVPATSGASLSTTVVTTAAPSASSSSVMATALVGALIGGLALAGVGWWLGAPRAAVAAPPPRAPDRPRDPALDEALALSRNRIRRHIGHAADAVLDRLRTLRAVLVSSRDALRQELDALGVRLGAAPADDVLDPVLGAEAPLHGHLLPARDVAKWLARSRRFTEPAVWADHLLGLVRPADGLLNDIPGADLAAVRVAARAQLAGSEQRSVFDDDDTASVAGDRTVAFLRRAVHAMAPAVVPRTAHGDPVQALRAAEILILLPEPGASVLTDVPQRADVPHATVVWVPDAEPRVLLVRTWEGLTANDLLRGAGLPEVTP